MLFLIIVLIIAGKMNRLLAAFIGAIIAAFFLLYVDKVNVSIVVGFIFGADTSSMILVPIQFRLILF